MWDPERIQECGVPQPPARVPVLGGKRGRESEEAGTAPQVWLAVTG